MNMLDKTQDGYNTKIKNAVVAETYSSERGRRCTARVTQTTVRLRGAEPEKKAPNRPAAIGVGGGGVLCTM